MPSESSQSKLPHDAIAVYKCDPALTAPWDQDGGRADSAKINDSAEVDATECPVIYQNKPSRLLLLPLELRLAIWQLVLPHTMPHHPENNPWEGTFWRLGHTALLATCHQIYEEGMQIMYSESVFHLTVERGARLYFSYINADESLIANKRIEFSEFVHASRIRYWHVDIPYLDRFMGGIFYGTKTEAEMNAHREGYIETFAQAVTKSTFVPRVRVKIGKFLKRWTYTEVDGISYLEPLRVLSRQGLINYEASY